MTRSRPTIHIFIGSSRESLPVVKKLKRLLATDQTKVIAWSDKHFFPPGETFLKTLTEKIRKFDFSIFVFGPDDKVKHRGEERWAPRDNVVFEYGLSMAYLGSKRTIALLPRIEGVPIKTPTDLAGLQLWEYLLPKDFPQHLGSLTRSQKGQLTLALKESCSSTICPVLDREGRRPKPEIAGAPGPRYIPDVYASIDRELKEMRKKTPRNVLTVLNIALDMEETWSLVLNRILRSDHHRAVGWRSLIINPDSPAIQQVASNTVSCSEAQQKIKSIRGTMPGLEPNLKKKRITFACRTYDRIPSFHGFLIGNSCLLLSFCSIDGGELDASASPYWEFRADQGEVAVENVVRAFKNWFEFLWNDAAHTKVWPHA